LELRKTRYKSGKCKHTGERTHYRSRNKIYVDKIKKYKKKEKIQEDVNVKVLKQREKGRKRRKKQGKM
jgi:hypothetical protein